MITPSATRWHTSSSPMKPCELDTERDMLASRPALQSNSSNHLVLILHRQGENCLLDTLESYGLTAQHSQGFI